MTGVAKARAAEVDIQPRAAHDAGYLGYAALIRFKARRGLQVRDLRARVADAQETLKSLKGQAERGEGPEDAARGPGPPGVLGADGAAGGGRHVLGVHRPAWHALGAAYSMDSFYVTGGPCLAWPR